MPPREPTSMIRAALQPRLLVILVVLLAAAAVCARLGVWQLERAQSRDEQAPRQQADTSQEVPAVPLDTVLAPQTSFSGELLGRAVTVTGTYEADGQLLVTDRSLDGRDGFLVLTPLRVAPDDGAEPGAAAVLPVVRGWVGSPDDAAAVPAGDVEVTGYLQASEAAGALDADAGRVQAISSAQLVNEWGGPIYSGYLVLAAASPAPDAGLELLPPPQPRGGTGWDIRNLGYAVQWWIFGLFAVALWLRLVRDEARGELPPGEEPPVTAAPVEGPPGEGTSGDGASGEAAHAGGEPDPVPDDERSVRRQAGADASP